MKNTTNIVKGTLNLVGHPVETAKAGVAEDVAKAGSKGKE